jgi:hypothetical protein
MQRDYPAAVQMDFRERLANNLRNIQRQDTNLGAFWFLAQPSGADAESSAKLREVTELLNINEAQYYHLRHALASAGQP